MTHAVLHLPPGGPSVKAYPCSAQGGFTLIELIIAITLVSLISLLIYSGLRLGTSTWEGVETRADETSALRTARTFLERELLQARQVQVSIEAQRRFVLAGDTQSLEFAAPLSEYVGIPGLYILRLTLGTNGQRDQLVLTRWLLNPKVLAGEEQDPAWQPLTGNETVAAPPSSFQSDVASAAFGRDLLLDSVGELAFSYFGAQQGELSPNWHRDWIGQPRPPLAVRVHLTTTKQTWPDALIPLAAPAQ
jgi:general secretion pathway protein J